MEKEQIVIVGGGNGALAFAAYFGLRGYPVRLWEFPEFRESLKAVYEHQKVQASGALHGEVQVECHEHLGEALHRATLIMGVVPAFAHARMGEEVAPFLQDNMMLVLSPGRTGGALEVAALLRKKGISIPVAETQSLLFACRRKGEQGIYFGGVKTTMRIGTFPARRTDEVMQRVAKTIPQFRAVPDVLTTSLGNIGAMFHPASALLNVGLVESRRSYDYYPETMTGSVVRVIERLDQERMALARAARAEVFSAQAWLCESYQLKQASLHEMLQNNPAYQGVSGPMDMNTRYITEDVPTGLVPMEAFGKLYGVPTPTMSVLISVASILTEMDFRSAGRNLERLDLAGLTPAAVSEFVREGSHP
jgi:opine dehydrogenase